MEWICNPPTMNDLIHPREQSTILDIQKSNLYMYAAQLCGDILANAVSIPDMVLTGYPVTKDSAPRIYRCYENALARLGCTEKYPLYVDFGYELSGKVYGSDENGYSIVINSECGEMLTDDELTAFLGGEIGHLLAGHPQNHALLNNIGIITKRMPFAGELVREHILGLFASWLIASEYTADRAALFASENIDAVISLRKQQMGFKNFETEMILNQKQVEPPANPGMYYVLMAGEMPIIGSVSRIQELCRWVSTKSFGRSFAPLLYKLCLKSKEIRISCNGILLEKHRKAADGDAGEMEILGEQYIFGKDGLPQCTITGESFLREAAFCGNARAMFLEGGCMELGMAGNRKCPVRAGMLFRAAASRGDREALKKVVCETEKEMPQAVLSAAKEVVRSSSLSYWVSLSGKQIDKQVLWNALNCFWAPVDEPVIAAELSAFAYRYTGIILTAGGIYGSWKAGGIPFYIDWQEFRVLPLTQMEMEGRKYLFCGDRPFYLCQAVTGGTMADFLIRIKDRMENGSYGFGQKDNFKEDKR